MKYTCPVCGYDELQHAPTDYSICPCCSTEFGSSDFGWSHGELRREWIQEGAKWSEDFLPEPPFWSPIEQLRNVGYEVTDEDKQAITSGQLGALPEARHFTEV